MSILDSVQDILREQWLADTALQARVYASRPNLAISTLSQAGIGYCPEASVALVDTLLKEYPLSTLLEYGLVKDDTEKATEYIPPSQRKYELTLRGRYTLPIRDAEGKIISFAGRALGDRLPKWKNLQNHPEHFTRGNYFYPEHLFNPDTNTVVLQEGYVDTLAAHQYGCDFALSMFGIEITQAQIRKLHAYQIHNYCVALDNDLAGRLGTLRTILAIKSHNYYAYTAIVPLTGDVDEMSSEEFWVAYENRRYVDEKDYHPLSVIMDTLSLIDLNEEKHAAILGSGGWKCILDFGAYCCNIYLPDIKAQIFDTFGVKVNRKQTVNLNRGYYGEKTRNHNW